MKPNLKDVYRRPYKMRAQGNKGLNTVVSLPPAVLDREARRHNLTIAEFLKQYVAVVHFGNFEGFYVTFEEGKK